MLIESEHALDIGKNIHMEIFLLGDEHINLTGRVAFCNAITGEAQQIYDIGIEFVSISEDNVKKLKAVIQLLQNMGSDSSITEI